MRVGGLLIAAIITAGCISPAGADVLYDQPYTAFAPLPSQNDTTLFGNYATVYDNFTLAANSTLTSVDWYGGYFNPPSQGVITGFTITIYQDNAGTVGASYATVTIPGNANETFVGFDSIPPGDIPAYSYSSITGAIPLLGGTQYWMSIVADAAFPPQWGWEDGSGGDGTAYRTFFGVTDPYPADFAFTLNGTPTDVVAVPEPSSLVVLGAGLVSLWCMIWRRRKNNDDLLAS